MLTKIHWLTFVLISIAFIINPQNPTASTIPDVKYEGEQLSVHASGVPLEQLLSMVEKHTGVQFLYDDVPADIDVFANFENSSLADGIRRILRPFNYALIYDESGHVNFVLVLNRQGASSKNPADQTELYASRHQIDMDEISGTHQYQIEAPPNDMFGSRPDQEDTTPFSEQVAGQDATGQDSAPPGVDENDTPPQGEESSTQIMDQNATPETGDKFLTPVVDPNVTPPPGQEPLKPVVDPDATPPPGQEPLKQERDADSTLPSGTEEQAVPEAKSNP